MPAVFRAGASGYLFKSGPSLEPFIKALELVMLGETVLPKAILPLILERQDEMVPAKATEDFAPQLSRQERLILRLLAEGHATKLSRARSASPERPSRFTSNRSLSRSASSIARRLPYGR